MEKNIKKVSDKLKITQYPSLRRTLFPMFKNGFADGWKMAVSEAFRDCLDIKYSPYNLDKDTVINAWSQGLNYSFAEGHILYDTPLAYEGLWAEALKYINLGVQIRQAKPAIYLDDATITTDNPIELNFKETNKTRLVYYQEGLSILQKKYYPGFVLFTVLRPNADRTQLVENESIQCTQESFILFLQSGIVRTFESKSINLLDFKAKA
jgi:hypothetical protein